VLGKVGIGAGGNVLAIDGGIETVVGIGITAMIDVGIDGKLVTGTKTTDDGTYTEILDGVETITLVGILIVDGKLLILIGINVDGTCGTVGMGLEGIHVQYPGVDG
jgi:hypothetical protein